MLAISARPFIKVSLNQMNKVDYVAECKRMVEGIRKLNAGESVDEPRAPPRQGASGGRD